MVLKGNFRSTVLEMNTGITIVLPDKYERGRDYKVAYVLHGLGGNNSTWADNTMLPVFARDYHTIFVLPEVNRSFYSDMEYGYKFFTYVTEELPIICESIFHISARREDTAVIGASMGGYGALKCALSRPEEYGYCVAISAACLHLQEMFEAFRLEHSWDLLREKFGEQIIKDCKSIYGDSLVWKPEHEILQLVEKAEKSPVRPQIYMACGYDDYLYADNLRFAEEMRERDFHFEYEAWKGGHDWYFFNEALKKGLQFCYAKEE